MTTDSPGEILRRAATSADAMPGLADCGKLIVRDREDGWTVVLRRTFGPAGQRRRDATALLLVVTVVAAADLTADLAPLPTTWRLVLIFAGFVAISTVATWIFRRRL